MTYPFLKYWAEVIYANVFTLPKTNRENESRFAFGCFNFYF